jgi:ribosomal-protein-alanine N-acetyltransferase
MGSGSQILTTALGPDDQAACLALDRVSLGGLWTPSQWSVELADPHRPGRGVRLEGELVAMACGWLILEELHITLVATCPRRRRQGLGRRALAELLRDAAAAGATAATLEVAVGNLPARALYEGVVFRSAGIRRGYYRNGDDALIKWMSLSGRAAEQGRKVRETA